MNILQYLQAKYKCQVPAAITRAEADAFGIPYPLVSGWLARHGTREVDDYMLGRAKNKLMSKARKNAKKGRKNSPHHLSAISVIANKSGPVSYPAIASYVPPAMPIKPPRERYVDPNSPDFLSSYAWCTLRMQAQIGRASCRERV